MEEYFIYSIYSTLESGIAGIAGIVSSDRFGWTLDFYSGIE